MASYFHVTPAPTQAPYAMMGQGGMHPPGAFVMRVAQPTVIAVPPCSLCGGTSLSVCHIDGSPHIACTCGLVYPCQKGPNLVAPQAMVITQPPQQQTPPLPAMAHPPGPHKASTDDASGDSLFPVVQGILLGAQPSAPAANLNSLSLLSSSTGGMPYYFSQPCSILHAPCSPPTKTASLPQFPSMVPSTADSLLSLQELERFLTGANLMPLYPALRDAGMFLDTMRTIPLGALHESLVAVVSNRSHRQRLIDALHSTLDIRSSHKEKQGMWHRARDEGRTVYIRGMSSLTDKEVREYLTDHHGPVMDMRYMFDPRNNCFMGYAFVMFEQKESVDSILRNQSYVLGNGVTLTVKTSDSIVR